MGSVISVFILNTYVVDSLPPLNRWDLTQAYKALRETVEKKEGVVFRSGASHYDLPHAISILSQDARASSHLKEILEGLNLPFFPPRDIPAEYFSS